MLMEGKETQCDTEEESDMENFFLKKILPIFTKKRFIFQQKSTPATILQWWFGRVYIKKSKYHIFLCRFSKKINSTKKF